MLKPLLLQVILIFLNAVFACAEIAVLSVNEAKLERMSEDGNRSAKRLFKLTKDPARFLATIQVAITLSGFLGSAFAADNFSGYLVDWIVSLGVKVDPATLDAIAVVLITLILSFVTLVFGELVPKRLAQSKSESLAMKLSLPVSIIAKLFSPIVWLLTVSTNGILRIFGVDPSASEGDVSEEEIRMMADIGAERGIIDSEDNEIIQNIFEFDSISVCEAMVHRTEVTMLDIEDSEKTWRETIHENVYDYYPVYSENSDNIVGVLDVKRYLTLEDTSKESVLENAVKKPCFISSYAKAGDIFSHMKEEGIRFAVVVDEFGGTDGIVTMSDLIKCLLGEYETKSEELPETQDGYRVEGSTELTRLEKQLKIEFDVESTTLNGWIIEELGKLPEAGEKLEYEKYEFTVTSVDEKAVREVTIKKLETEEDE